MLAIVVLIVGLFVVAAGILQTAHASVVINATRIVYAGPAREATVKLSNEGSAPALIQAWIDAGDPKAAPAAISVPFLVTPPVARIDPGRAQTLRIFYTGDPLPAERESAFFLNVLDIPPKPDSSGTSENLLQLAFRTRIKLFFRPEGLPGTAIEAPAQVRWRLIRIASGGFELEATNPGAYHVSFTTLRVSSRGGTAGTASNDDGGMVVPGGTHRFPFKAAVPAGKELTVEYHFLNDYGGAAQGSAPLNHY